jgi:methionyl-tRNA formyltransferase
MKVLFLGTPELAVPSLLAVQRLHAISLVVTQPDRPRGRGRQLGTPPVKAEALRLGLSVRQPPDLKGDETAELLTSTGAEILVVVAYGLLLPDPILQAFPHGAVNLHFSLLPSYRGAAPINWAIINGEQETGVTTFRLTSRMDGGPVYHQKTVPVERGETAGELGGRLAVIGAEALNRTLAAIEEGTLEAVPQNESAATFARKLKKTDGRIDWSRPSRAIVDHVRGVNPWPGAYTGLGGGPLKVWRAEAIAGAEALPGEPPGTILEASPQGGFIVSAGEGAVLLKEVQPAGKRRMPARDYLAGHSPKVGDRLS